MHAALAGGARILALLSPEYLSSDHCQAEWQNAIADDPLNRKSRLILLRVAECEAVGLLSGLAYWDLVPVRDNPPLLEEIVRNAVREERQAVAPAGPYWRAPRSIVDTEAIRPVSGFSGRESELAAVETALDHDGAVAVVHGLGGIGKSSLVREYAWRNRERYSIIWWLNAQTEDGIIEGVLRLGALFVRGLDQIADRRAAAQQVIGAVLGGFSKPVLLVFDNLAGERLLSAWLPRGATRALITSRNAAWSPGVVRIAPHAWDVETASAYLQRESGRADLQEPEAHAIAEALGGLPLALSHAAASLRNLRMVTPRRYVERIGERLKQASRGAEYPRSVFATFCEAIVEAEREAPGAAAVLCLAATFAPDAIPDELFRQSNECYARNRRLVMPDGNEALELHAAFVDDLAVDEALGALDRLSLLTFAPSAETYAMHRLVQLAARDLLGEAASAWRECAVAVACAAFPSEVHFATWSQCERMLPHARAALDGLPNDSKSLSAASLARACGEYLWMRAEYDAARPLLERALAIREEVLGPDDPDVALVLNNLANLYWAESRYAEAVPLHQRALAIRERAFGPDDTYVARSANNLATVFLDQGRYAEAEPLFKRALTIYEKTVGLEHRFIADSLNNIANLYYDQGRYAEAKPLHERALAIFEEMRGPDHPDVSMSLNNLANTNQELGDLGEAERLHSRALAIRERAFGPEHPDTALSLNNLAIVYRLQGRYDDAVALQLRALSAREKMLGPEHPDVAQSLNNLAFFYGVQGRFAEAEPLLLRAVAIHEKVFGSDHPQVAGVLHDLALIYRGQGRREDARQLLVRALSIREAELGPEHPLTRATRAALDEGHVSP